MLRYSGLVLRVGLLYPGAVLASGSSAMSGLRITVVIPTLNRPAGLLAALESLAGDARRQLIVVDNTLDGGLRLPAIAGDARLIHEPRPGISRARNAALEACDTEFIAFLDDDAVASPGWSDSLVEAYDRSGPDALAAGGPVRPHWEAPRPHWLPDTALGYLSLVEHGSVERVLPAGSWLAGTNIAFRRAALRDLGGFPDGLGRSGSRHLLSNEELSLLSRVRSTGGAVVYVPNAPVCHAVPADRLKQSWLRKRAAWQAVSDYLLDPERVVPTLEKGWRPIKHYLATVPRWRRRLRALAREVSTADEFERQLDAIYSLTVLTLAGYRDEP